MQVYYMDYSVDEKRIIATKNDRLEAKMKPLTRTILENRLKSKNDCDEYVKKIAVDITVHNSLGNPSKFEVRCVNRRS